MNLTSSRPVRASVAGLLSLGLSTGLALASTQSATAVASTAGKSSATLALRGATTAAVGKRVVSVAATKKGTPYRYGATGPRAFDCSGYTGWVYRQVRKSIPRTADQQYRATLHISRASARPGDLVFFGGSHKSHVAIYAGGNLMWHAPHSGTTVTLAKIYTTKVVFGRVR